MTATNMDNPKHLVDPPPHHVITLRLNGIPIEEQVAARLTLVDFLREKLALTGTHTGCEQGVCGACTILLDGEAMRSCLLLAVQANGHEITTIEGLVSDDIVDTQLTPLMQAMQARHGVQCGFCTPGVIVSMTAFLRQQPNATEAEIRHALSANLCRCTGYQGMVNAALEIVNKNKTDHSSQSKKSTA